MAEITSNSAHRNRRLMADATALLAQVEQLQERNEDLERQLASANRWRAFEQSEARRLLRSTQRRIGEAEVVAERHGYNRGVTHAQNESWKDAWKDGWRTGIREATGGAS
jgi:hypothetical protein